MQILNACKCLFVSHRKIAIYLESLNAEKKKKTANGQQQPTSPSSQPQPMITNVLNESTNIMNENKQQQQQTLISGCESNLFDESSSLSSSSSSSSTSAIKTCKLTLSDIRIPLSWKYSDHLKASKNAGKKLEYIAANYINSQGNY